MTPTPSKLLNKRIEPPRTPLLLLPPDTATDNDPNNASQLLVLTVPLVTVTLHPS